MAYTGAGTQADPYIPDNITSFLEVAQKNGVYVKLASNIDCANDPNYIGYFSDPIIIGNGTYIYSDTYNYIRGITVKATGNDMFISCNNNKCTIENIGFIDCFIKSTSYSMPSRLIGVNFTLLNCRFSIYSYIPLTLWGVGAHTRLNNCSIYIKFINTYICNAGTYYCGLVAGGEPAIIDNNIFIIDGGIMQSGTSWDYPIINPSYAINYNAFIFKNTTIEGNNNYYYNLLLSKKTNYCYFAFVNPTAYNGRTLNSVNISEATYSICATDINSWGSVFLKPTDVPNQIYFTTLDNLKDESYLLSIGFVP